MCNKQGILPIKNILLSSETIYGMLLSIFIIMSTVVSLQFSQWFKIEIIKIYSLDMLIAFPLVYYSFKYEDLAIHYPDDNEILTSLTRKSSYLYISSMAVGVTLLMHYLNLISLTNLVLVDTLKSVAILLIIALALGIWCGIWCWHIGEKRFNNIIKDQM